MVVRFKFLIKDADAVPELRVLNIFKRIKGVLISVESTMTLFSQEIAVTEGGP
jgi:hypothetical protein